MPKTKIQKNGGKITRKQKIINFKKEVKRCLLLSKEDREFWMNNAEDLPEKSLADLIKIVKEKNNIIDSYIKLALKKDKEKKYVNQLSEVAKKTKKKIIESKEDEEKISAEGSLAEQLKDI